MTLVERMMEPCVFMERKKVPDGAGGNITTWEEGMEFDCAITLDTTMEARIAESQGVKSLYTITTRKNMSLDYHDVLKRLSDGKVFRVTSDGGDKVSPKVSSLDMSQVTAEKWELAE